MDNSISSQRFVTPAFESEAVNANESAKEATAPAMQLLRSVALEEKLQNAVAALKESTLVKQPSVTVNLDTKLASFWSGMMDDCEERTGMEAVEHDRTRDLNYLHSKGRQLEREISRMPQGISQDLAAHKLKTFIATHEQRIEREYKAALGAVQGTSTLPSITLTEGSEYLRHDTAGFEPRSIEVLSGAESVYSASTNNIYVGEPMINGEIARFWDDMIDDAMLRSGRAEVEHIHHRDAAYLQDKVRDLELKISKMPAGAEKNTAASTLQRFADEQKQGIEEAYQRGLDRVAKSEAPPTPRVPLGLMETVEALTDELQKVSQSPIHGSGAPFIHLA